MNSLASVVKQGVTHYQIGTVTLPLSFRIYHSVAGDNTNSFDWTYITNVADAHILAIDALERDLILEELKVIDVHDAFVNLLKLKLRNLRIHPRILTRWKRAFSRRLLYSASR